MTQIKKILDKQGDDVFIRTSTKAVVDSSGNTVESRLQAMQDEINARQLEIGAVPSDLTPTEGSTNWVTSGGLFEKMKVLGDYYNPSSEPVQVLQSKYINTSSGMITTASSTTTYTVAFYEVPSSMNVDAVNIYIPKTTSNVGNLCGFSNNLSETQLYSCSGTGNGSAQTVDVNISHLYKYLAVAYNSTNGSPTVRYHISTSDIENMVVENDISLDKIMNFNATACVISGGYVSANGTIKTGYNSFKRSDYIPTYKATEVTITCSYSSDDANVIAFFNKSKNYLRGISILADEQSEQTYEIPPTTSYMIISNKNDGNLSVTLNAEGKYGFYATVVGMNTEIERISKEVHDSQYNILLVGNSFGQNTLTYIDTLLNNLDVSNINIQSIYVDGAGLDTIVTRLNNGTSNTLILHSGNKIASNGTLTSILSNSWDVIIFQQKSISADDYSTYNPYLAQLINAARRYCTNKLMKIAFLTSWGTYASTYANIVSAVRSMMDEYDIDILIPAGTAIQNLRGTSLNTDANDFSSDTNIQHLALGVGRYVASCTLYESCIKPYTGISVYSDETSTTSSSGTGVVNLTSDNRELCQKCASYANIYKYGAMNVESL